MKIAISQINPTIGDIEHNKELIIEQISIAKSNEADLIVFPEMAICGMPTYDLVESENFVERSLLAIAEISEFIKGIDVLIGTPTQNEDDIFNSVLHIHNCEIVAEFSKAMITSRDELFNYSGIESEYFPEGEMLENVIIVKGEKVFVAIGNDIEYIDQLEIFNGRIRFEAVVNPMSLRYQHLCGFEYVKNLQEMARKTNTPIITSNMVGGNSDIVYYGGSVAVNEEGKVVARAKTFEEDMVIIDTDDMVSFGDVGNKKPSPKAKTKETYRALVLGVKDYFRKNGFKKACLGLSGGIDSALVAVIAADAIGAENVEAILMPSQFSSDHSVSDAKELVKRLGIKSHIINIEPLYNSYMTALDPLFSGLEFSVAEENLQSRIRGSLLMAYSNKFGNIVLNTTNKCEAAMGYGTLYGDTNGAISILGDLYKGEIYDLCYLLNSDSEIIPMNILQKAPSAELRSNQKDSDTLPEYDVLDKLLYALIEEAKGEQELLAEGFSAEVIKKVKKSLAQNEYKRFQIPPVLRLSKVVLGKDIIMPLTGKCF